jgi:hypothetical protein
VNPLIVQRYRLRGEMLSVETAVCAPRKTLFFLMKVREKTASQTANGVQIGFKYTRKERQREGSGRSKIS